MSFLDRFKPQPKYRSPDPAIRLAGIAELPDDAEHRGVIAELAASDEDVRVRRAAIGRLAAVGYLSRLARLEKDDLLRRELGERLVAIANATGDTDGEAAQALDGMSDQKHFAAVAKASPHDTIRTAALGKINDVKLLGSVARNAADPQIAAAALARVTDAAELLAVALKTDHKEAGVLALERAAVAASTDAARRELLDNVSTRAKNKSVAKRARTMLQEIEDAAAAERAAREERGKAVAAAIARVDAIAAAPGIGDSADQLAEIERHWSTIVGSVDPDAIERFTAHLAQARAAIDAKDREEAERRAEAERAEARRAAFAAICQRVEALRGEQTPDELEKARAEWEGMPGAASQERDDDALRARFDEACRRATERHQRRQALEDIHRRLNQISIEADRLSLLATATAATPAPAAPPAATAEAQADGAGEDAAPLAEAAPEPVPVLVPAEFDVNAWKAVTSEWHATIGQADGLEPEITARFGAAEARVKARVEEARAARERAVRQQVQRVEQLLDRVTKRATAEDLSLREADRTVRDLRAAIEAPPAIGSREQHALVERLKEALSAVSPRLHELREMDEWKRFANAAIQEELIAKVEALRTKYHVDKPEEQKPEDIEKAARELHDIQERWKQVAEAPRAQAQALWHRYRQAADPIQAKAREFFAHRAEERASNLKLKMALIERAEALSESTDWIKTADELKKLQGEWQQIGPIPRQDTRGAWKRFRDACDRFFTRRNADLAERKETWSANLTKKDALCARAEELASSREWEKAAAEIRRLQAEWKTVGPVRRTKSEAIWQRFRTACDTFFERYKRRDEIEIESKQADREALVAELEALAPAGEDAAAAPETPADVLERVRSLRSRWNKTTPVVRQGADPLSARFVDALERLLAKQPDAFKGTELDVEASRQKMEKLCARVEGFLTETAAPTGSQALADMLREALAANTIGGRAGEESKWRGMAEEVRQAQASWSRLGPVPGEIGRHLGDRFHRACNRFFEQFRRRVPPQAAQAPRGKPVGAR
jgi:Domain of Unknown Function (DUF349)